MGTQQKVLIAGGTGFIGSGLAKLLSENGFQVALLSRSKQESAKFTTYQWDVENRFIEKGAFTNTHYLINLAGTNIAGGRWTKKRKKEILDSRIKSTDLLFHYVQKKQINLKAYLAVSATGYYGNKTTNQIFDETQNPGKDFLAKVCYQWEQASLNFQELGIRTIILRPGVVFDEHNGAYPKMTQSLKFGFISAVGSGKQYIPWIHVDDLLSLFLFCLQNNRMEGIFNAVAPEHITQNELTSKIKSISKKIRLPNLPGFFLKFFFGEMSSILLNGSRISADKLALSRFKFKLGSINLALKQLHKP